MARQEGSVEPLSPQVQLDVVTTPAHFGEAYADYAMKDNMLAEMGSKIAQSAGNALSTQMGYNEGNNPHGDLLPPITEADKHYQDSYLTQSKNVLGLQMQQMMSDAHTQLARQDSLNPGMIKDFQQQIGQGTADILKNAPTGIKQELATQYASSIISTTGTLQRRMLAQQKSQARQEMKSADKNTNASILENATMGNIDLSKKLYEDKVAQNKKQRTTGMMTELEESVSNKSAKLSYYSGASNSAAMKARDQKGDALGKYLASFTDLKQKPADLTFEEWNTLGNNTLSLMKHMDSLQQTDKNVIMSELNEKNASGTLTEQDLAAAYQSPSINETDVNNVLTKMYTANKASNAKELKVQSLITNFGNAQSFAETPASIVNDSYTQLTEAIKQKNPGSAPLAAEASVASMAGGAIPKFISTIENMTTSQNLDDVVAASNAYHQVQSVAPENVIGLSSKSYDMISAFDAFRQQNPGDPQTALAQTRNALLNKTPDEMKVVEDVWHEQYKKSYSTPELRANFAKKMLGANGWFSGVSVQNSPVVSDQINNILRKNVMLTGGDITAATVMTQKAVDNVYGETWVNGRHEVGYLSLEKIANLGEGGTHFIQKDIAEQVQPSLGMYKDAFDKGNSDYYYRMKNPDKFNDEPLKVKALRAKEITDSLAGIEKQLQPLSDKVLAPGSSNKGYYAGFSKDKAYNDLLSQRDALTKESNELQASFKTDAKSTGAIQIEKVWRGSGKKEGHVQLLNLATVAETNTTLSYDASQPVIGNYFIKLIDDRGNIQNLDSIQGFKHAPIYYTPNIGKIKQNYTNFHNRFGTGPSYDDELNAYNQSKVVKNGQ